MSFPQLNLIAAWAGLWLGFASGLGLGLNFHREDWLGGYGSFPRRLYRLGHISFFGLAAVNWMFYGTVQWTGLNSGLAGTAGWAFVAGAATMPVCCFLMAHWPRARLLFAVPVLSLLTGASFTLWELLQRRTS